MADKPKPVQGVAPRLAAAQLLDLMFTRRLPLDEALTRIVAKNRLNDDDRRLTHAICASVFRNLPAIDAILRRVMKRESGPTPPRLHQLLRVGAAQLIDLNVAPHAALHATVSATGAMNLSSRKSLVNAVLRSVQREHDARRIPAVAALDQLPQWLAGRWVKNYGKQVADKVATAMRQEAPVDLTIHDAQKSLQWAQELGGEVLLDGAVRVRHGPGQITAWPGFQTGAWWVQDIASSLPVRMLGDVAGKVVLDVCAAPGGKTMQLAAAGARVVALDVSASRIARLADNLARTQLAARVETVVADARNWQMKDTAHAPMRGFDAVLLDAPCAATGTLRRHPELPWIHDENQVARMTLIQRELLWRAPDWLAPGGIMLYVTCSMECDEGEDQVAAFLNHHKDFKLIHEIPDSVRPFLVSARDGLGFRTNPAYLAGGGGMDGFYIAPMKKS
ncbi:MAG: methyltransferase domain-containing protein [Rhodospirillales bacterium]|nr:methyltransferase domain-containing protein [Alphaproteobacteria bacterium]MCB9986408.1 methyltransferase domain-containing protein [Rhodospirillales bacterium]